MRTVELNEHQYQEIRRQFKASEVIGRVLGEAIRAAAQEQAEAEEECWDRVRAIAGVGEDAELRISWLSRTIEVLDEGESHPE